MPAVYNKKHKGIPYGAVYIGRGSVYGNPFSHLSYGQAAVKVRSRDASIRAYERWIDGDSGLIALVLQHDPNWHPPTAEQIAELRGKDVVCFCAPEPCHGDVLIRQANV